MAKDLVSRQENYSQWYNDLVIKAGLAESSAVRGCMVIKPYGYAIWEKMHEVSTRCSKRQVMKMPISRCLYQNHFLVAKQSMLKVLQRNAR